MWLSSHHLGGVGTLTTMTTAKIISAHIGIYFIKACLRRLGSLSTRQALVVQHHAVYLLGHVHLVITRLSFLLVCLALLAIAILVEARGSTPSHRLLLLLLHLSAARELSMQVAARTMASHCALDLVLQD